jgi:hypothetical protein
MGWAERANPRALRNLEGRELERALTIRRLTQEKKGQQLRAARRERRVEMLKRARKLMWLKIAREQGR